MSSGGEALRRRRMAAGLSQRELASRAGIGVRTLRDIERGHVSRPQRASLERLIAALPLTDPERADLLAAFERAAPRPPWIGVLGPLAVRRGGIELDVGAAMPRALLGLLALHAGQPVPVDEIVDILWEDRPPRTYDNLIHVYAARLRAALGKEAIQRTPSGYLLALPTTSLDLTTFEALTTHPGAALNVAALQTLPAHRGAALNFAALEALTLHPDALSTTSPDLTAGEPSPPRPGRFPTTTPDPATWEGLTTRPDVLSDASSDLATQALQSPPPHPTSSPDPATTEPLTARLDALPTASLDPAALQAWAARIGALPATSPDAATLKALIARAGALPDARLDLATLKALTALLPGLSINNTTPEALTARRRGDGAPAGADRRVPSWDAVLAVALACWRGPVLAGSPSRLREHPLAVAAARKRVAAALAYADAAPGAGPEVVAALWRVVHDEPLHEGLAARLMTALAEQGEQAAALRLYGEMRARLAEELDVEPGDDLRRARDRILARPPEVPAGRPPERVVTVPAQLPAAVAAFTGRAAALRRLDRLLEGRDEASVVAVLTGTAGVGKTALAVHWAHRARDRFPDGQLYVNLRGYAAAHPLGPLDALARFLHALGVPPEQVPGDLDEAAALYRTMLAGKRMLVVLDNASDPRQVRPLLPGGAGPATLITSRDTLAGLVALDGARVLPLPALTEGECRDLLSRLLGRPQVRAEPEAVSELASLCAHLPLALRIAAANLLSTLATHTATRQTARPTHRTHVQPNAGPSAPPQVQPRVAPHAEFHAQSHTEPPVEPAAEPERNAQPTAQHIAEGNTQPAAEHKAEPTTRPLAPPDAHSPTRPIARYVQRLRAGNRLDALQIPGDVESAVRTAFHFSYAALPPAAQRLFRLLGLIPGPDITVPAMAALLGTTEEEAEKLATVLRAASLLEEYLSGRFAQHDLLRLCAAEYARDEHAELLRLHRHYLDQADAAARTLYPQFLRLPVAPAAERFLDHAAASGWLDAELPNLLATVTHTAEHGPYEAAWLIADTLRGYFFMRHQVAEWRTMGNTGLAAARAAGEPRAQVALLLSLAGLNGFQGRQQQALDHYAEAMRLAEETGWHEALTAALCNAGATYADLGMLREAVDHLERALTLNEAIAHTPAQAVNLGNLGCLYLEMGRLHDAEASLNRSLALCRELEHRASEANGLAIMGEVLHGLDRLPDARDTLLSALDLHREVGNRGNEADTLRNLAAVERDAGNLDQALKLAATALDASHQTGHRRLVADTLHTLGLVHLALGDVDAALDHHMRALELARAAGNRYPETKALLGLAAGERLRGAHETALRHAGLALALARAAGYRLHEGLALSLRARISDDAGDARRATELFTELGLTAKCWQRALLPRT
ncbi:tetratricopeptide repeat protein [Nonomuraea sp. NPDC049646]|uniref:tetratricopeptide repeat protein n=1 Tax=unclassified Nonomuraea TaxID=2593643 RepID=UPI0037A0AACF